MKKMREIRVVAVAIILAAFIGGLFISRTSAQSDYSSGDRMPYEAFGRLPATDIKVGGGVIHAALSPGQTALQKQAIMDWVKTSAQAVTTYFGQYPVKSVKLLLALVRDEGVQGGTTWAYRGAAIRIQYGVDTTDADLKGDWMMVHEMVHLALPELDDRYRWLSEGTAVYIEPIARVQAGDLSAREIWAAMVRDMPKGLPRAGDQGLDNTSTWGRKYWGGAMFCLLADVEIRKRTNNKFGLQDAMRGLLAAGGNVEADWSFDKVLAVADKAVGLDTLTRMHQEMGGKPVSPDLDALWRDLGVKRVGNSVEFDDTAPLAPVRIAITKTYAP